MWRHSDQFSKGRVTQLIDSGISQPDIVRTTGIPQKTISDWSKKYRTTGRIDRKKGSGRKKVLDDRTSNRMIRWINSGKCDTGTDVQMELKNTVTTVSLNTVRRTLKDKNWVSVVKKKRPYLTKKHKKE